MAAAINSQIFELSFSSSINLITLASRDLPDEIGVEVSVVTNDREFGKPVLVECDHRASDEMFKRHGTDCVSHVKPKPYLLRGHLHQHALYTTVESTSIIITTHRMHIGQRCGLLLQM